MNRDCDYTWIKTAETEAITLATVATMCGQCGNTEISGKPRETHLDEDWHNEAEKMAEILQTVIWNAIYRK